MKLYPAIDLKNGACVRLIQGDPESATLFNADPLRQAQLFHAQGFSHLHVVDLDGAFNGQSGHEEIVQKIVTKGGMPVQLGGGIRTQKQIDQWLERGVSRVILGTAAVRDPNLVKQAARDYPGRIWVGVDVKSGKVAVEGWVQTSEIRALELAQRFTDAGVGGLIYTDVSRDGLLKGLDMLGLLALAEGCPLKLIASGGVASVENIRQLNAANCPNLEGVILGRALYEGKIDPKEALALAGPQG